MSYSAAPASRSNRRIELLDVVRGFALTGVVFANFTGYVSQQVPETVQEAIAGRADRLVSEINSVFFEWKFMTLFSILFGYGFGLILDKLYAKGIRPVPFFLRRMAWLFVFGILHSLFWTGDVLHLYAMSGALLLFFRHTATRWIGAAAILFMFFIPPGISYLWRDVPDAFTEAELKALYAALCGNSWTDLFAANIKAYYLMFITSGGNWHDISETLGRFLLGYFLMRHRLLSDSEANKSVFNKLALITAIPAAAYWLLRWLLLRHEINLPDLATQYLLSAGILVTTSFYTSLLVLAWYRFPQAVLFGWWRAIGRMTLTHYLLVSAFLIALLYGIGAGQLGSISLGTIASLAVCWLGIIITVSLQWWKNCTSGPAEWIWRQLTYGKLFPIRMQAAGPNRAENDA